MYRDYNKELYHHGIKGMKWGVRRYQNKDGSLTAAGKQRYGVNVSNMTTAGDNAINNAINSVAGEGTTDKWKSEAIDNATVSDDEWLNYYKSLGYSVSEAQQLVDDINSSGGAYDPQQAKTTYNTTVNEWLSNNTEAVNTAVSEYFDTNASSITSSMSKQEKKVTQDFIDSISNMETWTLEEYNELFDQYEEELLSVTGS